MHRIDRWLYRGGRPHLLARILNRAWSGLAASGVGPRGLVQLEVVGRKTGRPVSFPVVVADYQAERYLVSMLGEDTSWVRNVRAASGRAVLRHGRREPVQLQEVGPDERAPILRRYLECAPGGRPHFPVDRQAPIEEFEAIAGQFPVFRITVPESSAN
ncbi:MAG: nitroreductase/quinone reductase family protein [Acidimicrobiales bacterium]